MSRPLPSTSRRFVPQPIETTTKSRRSGTSVKVVADNQPKNGTNQHEPSQHAAQRPRVFRPELVETSTSSTRDRLKPPSAVPSSAPGPCTLQEASAQGSSIKSRRRFTPELIETSKVSRRGGNATSQTPQTDTRESLHERHTGPPTRGKQQGNGTAPTRLDDNLVVAGLRFSELREVRRTSSPGGKAMVRQHSFQVPSLDPIESSESDESNCPSLSTSPSAPSDRSAEVRRRAQRLRESCDDNHRRYFLNLAADAVEKTLREQAMAAFPNSDFHEPVSHFAIDQESDDSDDGADDHLYPPMQELPHERLRRKSTGSHSWEVQSQRRRSISRERESRIRHRVSSRHSIHSPLAPLRHGSANHDASLHSRSTIRGEKRDVEIATVKKAKSPPMLGQDLKFRVCQSPQATTDKYPPSSSDGAGGPERDQSGGGLWMGFCVASKNQASVPEKRLSVLMTPAEEIEEPLMNVYAREESDQANGAIVPAEPSVPSTCVDAADAEHEVTDEFVTQVFNYLSLGYPSLARKFDAELSKISRIPLELFRQDDNGPSVKGFVGLEEGNGTSMKAVREGQSVRWRALRLYIVEWMRQHPNVGPGHLGPDEWGVRARRGSWAI